jgi:RNA polymerase sigma-70 factor (ECF subfamily)
VDIYVPGLRLPAFPAKAADDQTLARPTVERNPDTDEFLISKVRLGDHDVIAELFRRHARAIYRLGSRMLRDSGEAEDLVQEVFLYLFRRSELFDAYKGTGRSWIFQIAYTQALLRRRKLKAIGLYSSAAAADLHSSEASADSLRAYDTTLEGLFGRGAWKKVTEELTEDQCETLRLHFFEGCTFAEIAEKLGQSYVNIRNHHYRGLEKLRKHLGKGELNRR